MLGGIAETRIMKTNTDAQAFVISDSTGPRGRREKKTGKGSRCRYANAKGIQMLCCVWGRSVRVRVGLYRDYRRLKPGSCT
jgi:hypothetical protein